MRSILQIGNVAGIPQEFSRSIREMGFKSDILSFEPHPFSYELDLSYSTKIPPALRSVKYIGRSLTYIERGIHVLNISDKYDLFHFHFSSFLRNGLDLPLWRRRNKKIIIHHHGSDIRFRGEPLLCSKLADYIFVSTPDLLEWSPTAFWIPNPISLDRFPYLGVEQKDVTDVVNVVHAPSNRIKKGTEFIINAVDILKNEGYNVNLILIENLSHNRAIEEYKKADIIIDQLIIGWYGVFALECMALGKPVCAFIREDLEGFSPSEFLINVSTENIVESLKMLVEDEEMRKEFGKLGRRYVEEVHDSRKIARRLIEFYKD